MTARAARAELQSLVMAHLPLMLSQAGEASAGPFRPGRTSAAVA